MGEYIVEKINLICVILCFDLVIFMMFGFIEVCFWVGYFYFGKFKNKIINEKLWKYVVKDYMLYFVVIKENMIVYDVICIIFLEDVSILFIINENNDFVGVCFRKDLFCVLMIGEDIYIMFISVNMIRMFYVLYLKE